MKVNWTDTAQSHLDAIYGHIAQDSIEYALRMVDRLTRRSQVIARFPLAGRKVPEYDMHGLREVVDGPYRVIYYIKPDQVDVIAVIHGARDLRSAMQAAAWAPEGPPA